MAQDIRISIAPDQTSLTALRKAVADKLDKVPLKLDADFKSLDKSIKDSIGKNSYKVSIAVNKNSLRSFSTTIAREIRDKEIALKVAPNLSGFLSKVKAGLSQTEVKVPVTAKKTAFVKSVRDALNEKAFSVPIRAGRSSVNQFKTSIQSQLDSTAIAIPVKFTSVVTVREALSDLQRQFDRNPIKLFIKADRDPTKIREDFANKLKDIPATIAVQTPTVDVEKIVSGIQRKFNNRKITIPVNPQTASITEFAKKIKSTLQSRPVRIPLAPEAGAANKILKDVRDQISKRVVKFGVSVLSRSVTAAKREISTKLENVRFTVKPSGIREARNTLVERLSGGAAVPIPITVTNASANAFLTRVRELTQEQTVPLRLEPNASAVKTSIESILNDTFVMKLGANTEEARKKISELEGSKVNLELAVTKAAIGRIRTKVREELNRSAISVPITAALSKSIGSQADAVRQLFSSIIANIAVGFKTTPEELSQNFRKRFEKAKVQLSVSPQINGLRAVRTSVRKALGGPYVIRGATLGKSVLSGVRKDLRQTFGEGTFSIAVSAKPGLSESNIRKVLVEIFTNRPVKIGVTVAKNAGTRILSALRQQVGQGKAVEIKVRAPSASRISSIKRTIQNRLGSFDINLKDTALDRLRGKLQSAIQLRVDANDVDDFLNRIQNRLNKRPLTIPVRLTTGKNANSASGVDQFTQSLRNVSKQQVANANATKNATRNQRQYTAATKQASAATETFAERVGFSTTRLAAYLIPATSIFQLAQAFRTASSAIADINVSVTKLTQIFNGQGARANAVAKEVLKTAETYGVAGRELLTVTTTLAQAGELFGSNQNLIAITEKLAQTQLGATFGDLNSTTEGLIASLNQFNLTAADTNRVLDVTNNLSKNFAVEADNIFQAVRRGGAAFAAVGGSFEEFSAVVAAVRSLTRLNATAIGTNLNTVVAKLSTADASKFLKQQLGVDVRDAEGNVKKLTDIVLELGRALRVEGREGLIEAIDTLAGKRQVKILGPLLNDIISSQEGLSTLEKTLKATQNSAGSLARDAAIGAERLDIIVASLGSRFDRLFQTFEENKAIKGLVKDFVSLGKSLADVIETVAPIIPSLIKFGSIRLAFGVAGSIGQFIQGARNTTPGPFKPGSVGDISGGRNSAITRPIDNNTSALRSNTAALQRLSSNVTTPNRTRTALPQQGGPAAIGVPLVGGLRRGTIGGEFAAGFFGGRNAFGDRRSRISAERTRAASLRTKQETNNEKRQDARQNARILRAAVVDINRNQFPGATGQRTADDRTRRLNSVRDAAQARLDRATDRALKRGGLSRADLKFDPENGLTPQQAAINKRASALLGNDPRVKLYQKQVERSTESLRRTAEERNRGLAVERDLARAQRQLGETTLRRDRLSRSIAAREQRSGFRGFIAEQGRRAQAGATRLAGAAGAFTRAALPIAAITGIGFGLNSRAQDVEKSIQPIIDEQGRFVKDLSEVLKENIRSRIQAQRLRGAETGLTVGAIAGFQAGGPIGGLIGGLVGAGLGQDFLSKETEVIRDAAAELGRALSEAARDIPSSGRELNEFAGLLNRLSTDRERADRATGPGLTQRLLAGGTFESKNEKTLGGLFSGLARVGADLAAGELNSTRLTPKERQQLRDSQLQEDARNLFRSADGAGARSFFSRSFQTIAKDIGAGRIADGRDRINTLIGKGTPDAALKVVSAIAIDQLAKSLAADAGTTSQEQVGRATSLVTAALEVLSSKGEVTSVSLDKLANSAEKTGEQLLSLSTAFLQRISELNQQTQQLNIQNIGTQIRNAISRSVFQAASGQGLGPSIDTNLSTIISQNLQNVVDSQRLFQEAENRSLGSVRNDTPIDRILRERLNVRLLNDDGTRRNERDVTREIFNAFREIPQIAREQAARQITGTDSRGRPELSVSDFAFGRGAFTPANRSDILRSQLEQGIRGTTGGLVSDEGVALLRDFLQARSLTQSFISRAQSIRGAGGLPGEQQRNIQRSFENTFNEENLSRLFGTDGPSRDIVDAIKGRIIDLLEDPKNLDKDSGEIVKNISSDLNVLEAVQKSMVANIEKINASITKQQQAYEDLTTVIQDQKRIEGEIVNTRLDQIRRSREVGATSGDVLNSLNTLLQGIPNEDQQILRTQQGVSTTARNARSANDRLSRTAAVVARQQSEFERGAKATPEQVARQRTQSERVVRAAQNTQVADAAKKASEATLALRSQTDFLRDSLGGLANRGRILQNVFQELTNAIRRIEESSKTLASVPLQDRRRGEIAARSVFSLLSQFTREGGPLARGQVGLRNFSTVNPEGFRKFIGSVASLQNSPVLRRQIEDIRSSGLGGTRFPGTDVTYNDVIDGLLTAVGLAIPDPVTGRRDRLNEFQKLAQQQSITFQALGNVEDRQLAVLITINRTLIEGLGSLSESRKEELRKQLTTLAEGTQFSKLLNPQQGGVPTTPPEEAPRPAVPRENQPRQETPPERLTGEQTDRKKAFERSADLIRAIEKLIEGGGLGAKNLEKLLENAKNLGGSAETVQAIQSLSQAFSELKSALVAGQTGGSQKVTIDGQINIPNLSELTGSGKIQDKIIAKMIVSILQQFANKLGDTPGEQELKRKLETSIRSVNDELNAGENNGNN